MKGIPAALAILALLCASAAVSQSGRTSEESPPIDCGNRLVNGIVCSGSYCDNVYVNCAPATYDIESVAWTQRISEEDDIKFGGCFLDPTRLAISVGKDVPSEVSQYDGIVSGLSCSGHYCDDIFLRCSKLTDFKPDIGAPPCFWTPWISEESNDDVRPGFTYTTENIGATAMQCRGSNCDDKRFFFCPLVAR